jgi:hypothetical protein
MTEDLWTCLVLCINLFSFFFLTGIVMYIHVYVISQIVLDLYGNKVWFELTKILFGR